MNPNTEKKTDTTTASAVTPSQIRPDMKVVCSENGQFGVVDHMQGPTNIKLKKDADGVHHYIPLSWITRVDDKLHADRPGAQAMKEWSTEAPKN